MHFMLYSEFSETLNQAYFLRKILVLYAYIFLLGILIYANFSSSDVSQTPLKTPEDDSGSPNLASATKDQQIPANSMPQGLS